MATYQLAFDDLDVARIRPADASDPAPLAWFRVIWHPGSNQVDAVHVYGHAGRINDRPWLAELPTINDAVAYCDRIEHINQEGEYDWSEGSVLASPGE